MHDHYNEIGVWFVMNRRTWPQLEALARTADPARSAAVASLLAWTEDLKLQNRIKLFGDNGLDKNPLQRLLITLVTARSIVDVVESFATRAVKDSFTTYFWESRGIVGNRLHAPEACIAFGYYANYYELSVPPVARPEPRLPCFEVAPAQAEAVAAEETRAMGFWADVLERFHRGDWMLGNSISPILGVSVDYQDFPGVRSSGRALTTVEALVGGLPPIGNFIRDEHGRPLAPLRYGMGLSVGYTLAEGDGYYGHGPTLRLIVPITDLNLQFSVVGGARDYVRDDRSAWRGNYSLMFEAGFSVLTARLGIGRDWQFRANGRLEDGFVISAGIGLGLPWSRLRRGFE